MAVLKDTTANSLTVTGTVTFAKTPTVNSKAMFETEQYTGFIATGPYYRMTVPLTLHTSILAQNPLQTTPLEVNPDTSVVPVNLYGRVLFLDCWVESSNSVGTGDAFRAIWITRRRGDTFSGDSEWIRNGYLHQGESRWMSEYRIYTDDRGRFDIWSYTGVWRHQIVRFYIRGIGLKA